MTGAVINIVLKHMFSENIPIYLQIMDHVKQDICSGRIAMGGKLPSVRDKAIELGVNPNTVRHAYQELESEGIIFTQRGMGTFVTEDSNKIDSVRNELAQRLVRQLIDGMTGLGFKSRQILLLVDEYLSNLPGDEER